MSDCYARRGPWVNYCVGIAEVQLASPLRNLILWSAGSYLIMQSANVTILLKYYWHMTYPLRNLSLWSPGSYSIHLIGWHIPLLFVEDTYYKWGLYQLHFCLHSFLTTIGKYFVLFCQSYILQDQGRAWCQDTLLFQVCSLEQIIAWN